MIESVTVLLGDGRNAPSAVAFRAPHERGNDLEGILANKNRNMDLE